MSNTNKMTAHELFEKVKDFIDRNDYITKKNSGYSLYGFETGETPEKQCFSDEDILFETCKDFLSGKYQKQRKYKSSRLSSSDIALIADEFCEEQRAYHLEMDERAKEFGLKSWRQSNDEICFVKDGMNPRAYR